MDDYTWARRAGEHAHILRRSCETLLGLCRGLLADRELNDTEIRYLGAWLEQNAEVACGWPGEVVAERVRAVLSDGVISAEERDSLVFALVQLTGEHGLEAEPVSELPYTFDGNIQFAGESFCLSGNFVYGPRARVVNAIEERGGAVIESVRQSLDYLIVGAMGNAAWKHSGFGTKIMRAVEYRKKGCPIQIVSEERWARCLA